MFYVLLLIFVELLTEGTLSFLHQYGKTDFTKRSHTAVFLRYNSV